MKKISPEISNSEAKLGKLEEFLGDVTDRVDTVVMDGMANGP